MVYDSKIKFEDWLNGNFWNNLFFFYNIITYLIFCSYLATLQYSDLEWETTRDRCVEGAWYEMQMATQLKDALDDLGDSFNW